MLKRGEESVLNIATVKATSITPLLCPYPLPQANKIGTNDVLLIERSQRAPFFNVWNEYVKQRNSEMGNWPWNCFHWNEAQLLNLNISCP